LVSVSIVRSESLAETKMKAVVYEAFNGPLTVRQVPEPGPAEDGVVIRVKANGICRSDWHAWKGHIAIVKLPQVPGHEMAGVVEEVGPLVTRWKKGDRVTTPFNIGCGRCPQCQMGNEHLCDNVYMPGFGAAGSFAEFCAVPHADTNLVRLPDDLDFAPAAALGCRFSTAFRAVLRQGRLSPGEWLVVHGCGGVGLSAIMIANAVGAQAIGVDINPEALTAAKSLGAARVFNSKTDADVIAKIRQVTGGGAHVAVDALGVAETCVNALICLRKKGRHVQVGIPAEATIALPIAYAIFNEVEIVGSLGMQAHAYPPMLDLVRSGVLPVHQLVTKRVTLEQSAEALAGMDAFAGVGVTVIDRF
jgi:alcohol dehydrogenase